MKTFKQFINEAPGDEDMGIIQGLASGTVLGIKAIEGIRRKINSAKIANKKLNKKVSNTRRGS